ncbi:MAG TPA: transglutaminase domain-containing protein [Kofleriaceae bacterium]|jgi:transglutaminase-like putative cysteine protease
MRRRVLAMIVVSGVTAGVVLAQTATPILHEPIPDLAPGSPAPTIGGAKHGGNPTAIVSGDKVLAKPALERSAGEPSTSSSGTSNASGPVLGTKDFSADRATTMEADEHTGSDGTLHYISVFNPDVLPFKRMSAFDAVDDSFRLVIGRRAQVELPVGGTTDPRTRDRFWGDVDIQLAPGVDVALPSVAPDMRILSYETKPAVRLSFSKDGADNFFVRTDESGASGTYHLVFYADADAGYFAPQLPGARLRVRDVAAQAPREIAQALPDEVRREAAITLGKLGVDADMDLGVAFNKLVGYFRAFQAGELRDHTGNTYRDLCDSQVGVCRHRSFAFMITANALGIPTRLVENEAHAFVEVWFPQRGWQRIDLGGAALRMDVAGASNKTLHRPRADDPFVKPPEYTQSYTQLEGDIRGLSDQQLADKRRSLDDAPPSGATSSTTAGATAPSPDRITPDPTLPHVAQDPKKPTPRLLVTLASTSAYRGDLLHVEGIARVDARPLADHVVAVYLAPAGDNGQHSVQIGSAKTGADGTFRVDLPVPGGLALATYEIYLSSLEDARYNAALSD